LIKIWGFYKGSGRIPHRAEIRGALANLGASGIQLDARSRTVRFLHPSLNIDPGGIGKGYAVDRVVALLRSRGVGSALVNLGGSSVYGLGSPPATDAWEIGIQDPAHRDRIARTVRLRDRALSVSGGYERYFEKDGVTYTHIMDPRTGRPVTGVLSVAVLSGSATDGDAIDDVLFVQGLAQAAAFLVRHPSTQAFLFLPASDRSWRLEIRP
jgi:thiamine biosynthesis lipoprotein